MFNLIGTYECKADVKGRVMVPIALKKQIDSCFNTGLCYKKSCVSALSRIVSHGGMEIVDGENGKTESV